MRKKQEIQKAENEYYEKLWYLRHMSLKSGYDQKSLTASEEAEDRIIATYSKQELDLLDYTEVEAKLSALRWVLGYEWDCLDT